MWYAALPEDEWPEDDEAKERIRAEWREPWGDRRQELVLIGVDLNEAALRERLDRALLTQMELELGPKGWARLQDPFPVWMDEAAA